MSHSMDKDCARAILKTYHQVNDTAFGQKKTPRMAQNPQNGHNLFQKNKYLENELSKLKEKYLRLKQDLCTRDEDVLRLNKELNTKKVDIVRLQEDFEHAIHLLARKKPSLCPEDQNADHG